MTTAGKTFLTMSRYEPYSLETLGETGDWPCRTGPARKTPAAPPTRRAAAAIDHRAIRNNLLWDRRVPRDGGGAPLTIRSLNGEQEGPGAQTANHGPLSSNTTQQAGAPADAGAKKIPRRAGGRAGRDRGVVAGVRGVPAAPPMIARRRPGGQEE